MILNVMLIEVEYVKNSYINRAFRYILDRLIS
jgi:hypothetical protein